MNLGSSLSRLEASQAQSVSTIDIVATDEADFVEQFESALVSQQSIGTVSMCGSIGGKPYAESITLLPHEDALDALQ